MDPALHTLVIVELHTQVEVAVAQANLATIVKVQTSIPPAQAAFHITTDLRRDGM